MLILFQISYPGKEVNIYEDDKVTKVEILVVANPTATERFFQVDIRICEGRQAKVQFADIDIYMFWHSMD